MNVYWGYGATGKTCLEYQHLYGGKSFTWISEFCAKTRFGTVHLTGFKKRSGRIKKTCERLSSERG